MTLELGTTSLSQARLARGLTLEDAEHSTRISRRFLVALEEHDYSVFPAPIYARGFLRTYCRYLGVDPDEQLSELPAGWAASTPTTHLPPVSHGPWTLNFKYVVAGAVLAAIVGLGLFLSRGGQDLGALQDAAGPGGGAKPAPDATFHRMRPRRRPQRRSNPSAQPTLTVVNQGRALDPGLPGTLPDFANVDIDEATSFLSRQGITYLRIDTASANNRAGLVISQSPAAGTSTSGLAQVTLTVSAATAGTTRTDCSVLGATNHRTAAEQSYFENNCGSTASNKADRTDCEEIRGTDYRSPQEREYFLANCTTQ